MPLTVESVAPAASDAAIASLHQLLGDRLSTAAPVCEQHGKDASYRPPWALPDAVAFAQSTEEVSEVMFWLRALRTSKLCRDTFLFPWHWLTNLCRRNSKHPWRLFWDYSWVSGSCRWAIRYRARF
jgi:hypothetical protein